LRLALADPKVIKSFAVNAAAVFPPAQQTPEAATRMVHAEVVRWGDIIRANRIEDAVVERWAIWQEPRCFRNPEDRCDDSRKTHSSLSPRLVGTCP
jgi:hypothetical protein